MPSAALLAALDMPGLVRDSEKSQRALSFWRDGFSYLAGGPGFGGRMQKGFLLPLKCPWSLLAVRRTIPSVENGDYDDENDNQEDEDEENKEDEDEEDKDEDGNVDF